MRKRGIYIYQNPDWPNFTWNHLIFQESLSSVRVLQGRLAAQMESLGFSQRTETFLQTLTLDVIKTSDIEGEKLDQEQVRSSIARHLGIQISGLTIADRNVDGVVEMALDATQNFNTLITKKRLFNWQSSLFPEGKSGKYKILTNTWRRDETGPMQVISGALGKEKVHFEAIPAMQVNTEMKLFISWFNKNQIHLDPIIKAAIAHLWFITIHPFEDGNGRIARALTDMQLAKGEKNSQRYYSMSAQIRKQRKSYYEVLELTQKGTLEITSWLNWFIDCLLSALIAAESTLDKVLAKVKFWQNNIQTVLNTRQKSMLNKLMDGFEGQLNSSKWAKINKCSGDTALRDIQDLINKNILIKSDGGGRSTNYKLIF